MTVRELIEELKECDPDLEVKSWDNYEIVSVGSASEVYAPDYGLEEDIVLLYKD